MKRALSEAFARYGMSVSVLHGGETAETKAFLQLVKRENGEEPFSVTALGAVDEQCWRYLGPADVAVAMGDFVQCGEKRYVVRAAGPFYVGEEIACYTTRAKDQKQIEDCTTYLNKIIRANGYKCHVKIFDREKAFLERLDSLNRNYDELEKSASENFKPDERYPDLSRTELVKHTMLALAL